MALTTTSPFKSGTLSSVGTGVNGANTRLNTSGILWASSDIGRMVYFYSGAARTEARKIVGIGTNRCDIEYAFGWFPIADDTGDNAAFSDAPSAGDSVGVSYLFDDIDNGTDLIKENDRQYHHPTGRSWTIGTNVMVYGDKIDLNYSSLDLDLDGVLRLGNIDVAGNVDNVCSVTDTADDGGGAFFSSFGGFALGNNNVSTDDDFGAFQMCGGVYRTDIPATATSIFLRAYRDATTDHYGQSLIIDITTSGKFGARFHGSKCIQRNVSAADQQSIVGLFNNKSPFGKVDGITLNSGTQAWYQNWALAGTTGLRGLRFSADTFFNADLGDTPRIARAAGDSNNETFTFVDFDIQEAEDAFANGVDFWVNDTSNANSSIIKIDNELTLSVQNGTTGFKTEIYDNTSTTVYSDTDTSNGAFPTQQLEYGRFTLPSSGSTNQTIQISQLTLRAPYTYLSRKYDKTEQPGNWDARLNASNIVLDINDNSIVEANEAAVSAYTTLDTLDEVRDRWKHETITDFSLTDTAAGGGVITSAGYDLVINSGAASAWGESAGTITLKPTGTLAAGSTYTGLIIQSGDTLTLTTTISAALTVSGSASVPDVDRITGSLTINGGTVTFSGSGDKTLPSGSANATGRIVFSGAASGDRFTATEFTFNAATVVENTSGQPIVIELAAGQQQPTALETSGTITFETPVVMPTFTVSGQVADSEIRMYLTGTTTEVAGIESSGTSFDYTYTWTGDFGIDLVVFKEDRLPIRVENIIMTQNDATLPIQQQFDRNFVNP